VARLSVPGAADEPMELNVLDRATALSVVTVLTVPIVARRRETCPYESACDLSRALRPGCLMRLSNTVPQWLRITHGC